MTNWYKTSLGVDLTVSMETLQNAILERPSDTMDAHPQAVERDPQAGGQLLPVVYLATSIVLIVFKNNATACRIESVKALVQTNVISLVKIGRIR